jgi:ABC-type lipoprotein release transport system permease subunit
LQLGGIVALFFGVFLLSPRLLAFLVSLVATFLPAVRAARVPPAEAVRSTE